MRAAYSRMWAGYRSGLPDGYARCYLTVMLMVRFDAGVFKYLACDKVRVHLPALAGAMRVAPLMRQPPVARHVALPFPLSAMSLVREDEAPLRTVFVTTAAFGAVVVVVVVVAAAVVVVAAVAGAWPTASTGAE